MSSHRITQSVLKNRRLEFAHIQYDHSKQKEVTFDINEYAYQFHFHISCKSYFIKQNKGGETGLSIKVFIACFAFSLKKSTIKAYLSVSIKQL